MRTSFRIAIRMFVPRFVPLAFAAVLFFCPMCALAAVSVTISPTTINLPPGATQQFAAVVTGSLNTGVTWTVQEAQGGTIDATGLYIAPIVVGEFHVVATSQADGTTSATATVVVPGFVSWGLNTPRARGTATQLPSGKILFAGGDANCGPSAEVYDPAADRSTNTTGMLVARCVHTATLLPNGKILLAGGQSIGGDTASAELFDPGSGTFTATGSMAAPRSQHTATLLANGKVLMAGGVVCDPVCIASNTAELYDAGSGTFTATGSMSFPRNLPTATLLSNGTVLVAGGIGICTSTTPTACPEELVAEIYNPATGTFSQTGTMVGEANEESSVPLANGQVLFVGGVSSTTSAVTDEAEIYDPSSGTFTHTGSLNVPRGLTAASLMSNGNVLIVGGVSTNSYPMQAEIYDPSSGKFTLSGSMHDARIFPTAILLANGEVEIAGGVAGQVVGSTEIYDPGTGVFSSKSVFMNVARVNDTATGLADGRIMVAGGQSAIGQGNVIAEAEIYGPLSRQFTPTGSMSTPREFHTATKLPSGEVLVVGGFTSPIENSIVPTAELFNPAVGTFSLTGRPATPRANHSATLLQNGKVLIAGGQSLSPNNPGLTSAELYDPSTGTFSSAGNMTVQRFGHTATLLNDGRVLIAGGIPTVFGTPAITGPPAEVYDPASGAFTGLTSATNSLYFPNTPFDSVQLPSGKVLASLAFLFDPTSDTFSSVPNGSSFNTQNYKFSAIPNGEVLITGGGPAFLFDPVSEVFSAPINEPVARSSPAANLLQTGQVLISGGTSSTQVDLYQPPVAVPAPVIASISPNPVTGFSPVTITVQGANFAPGALIKDFGAPLQTMFVSDTKLTAIFTQSQLVIAGNHPIEVANIQDARIATTTLLVVNPQLTYVVVSGNPNFSNVILGSTSAMSVSYTNEGNAPMTVDSIGISGANSANFVIDPGGTNCPLLGGTLTAQTACTVTVKFTPATVTTYSSDLNFNYQTPSSPQVIALSGMGVGVPALSVSPSSLTFASQNIGTASTPQTLTISSTGTAALAILNVVATSGFQQTNICPSSLAPNATCSVFVTFVPNFSGANAGTLAITANDSGSQHVVQLAGTGIGVSTSAIAPTSITFGDQGTGTSSAAQQVILASIGTVSLQVSSIALTNTTDFKQTNNCPASLVPSANCSIAVTFAPASAGNINGSMVISANDGAAHTIPLSGTGTNFSLALASGAPSTVTVTAGQPASYQMSLSTQVISGAVNLTCGEPTPISYATCTVSPNVATPTSGAAVPVTVTLTTTSRSGVFAPDRVRRSPYVRLSQVSALRGMLILMLLSVLLEFYRKSPRCVLLVVSVFFLLALAATGCGSMGYNGGGTSGSSAGTPAGTYQLVVSASGSGITRTMMLSVAVQ